MIILIFLHMGRTFVFGAYKYRASSNWRSSARSCWC